MKYKCRCCGYYTFPAPPVDAIAYICPVCNWENDVFTTSDDEPSDENHGITLNQGRANFSLTKTACPERKKYVRAPSQEEITGES